MLVNRLSYSHFEQLVELDDAQQRAFYEAEALRGTWSVRELKRQIATQYYQRSGLSTNKAALSKRAHAAAERAAPQQVIRDPYVFEFLSLKPHEVVTEGQLEDALLEKLQAFVSRYQVQLPGTEEMLAFLERAVQELENGHAPT